MHDTAKLLHFDLKPDNVLVSDEDRAFVTDLGFARDFTRYTPEDIVKIGFTWKYAHPNLTARGARISQTQAKAKNEIPAKQLKPIIDLFAFYEGHFAAPIFELLWVNIKWIEVPDCQVSIFSHFDASYLVLHEAVFGCRCCIEF